MGKRQIIEESDQDSITLKMNTKGEQQYDIKAYGSNHEEMAQRIARSDLRMAKLYKTDQEYQDKLVEYNKQFHKGMLRKVVPDESTKYDEEDGPDETTGP